MMYSPNKLVGQNMINTFMKEACKKLKLKCTGHGLCALSISTVINEVANAEEALAFSRHNSLAAQQPYHRSGHKTEMAKFKALGLVKYPRFERRVIVGGGPSPVTVHVGDKDEEGEEGPPTAADKDEEGEEGPPAAATAKRQEDDKSGDEDEGATPRKGGAAA